MQLPEQQPTRPGQPTDRTEVRKFAAAVEEALAGEMQTSVRIVAPDVPSWEDGPRIGATPPVAQPGQPPMSQWAVDASGVMKAIAVTSLPVGGALWLVGQVDPLTLGIICGSPVALALAVGRLVARIKAPDESAPAPTHHHYHGHVTQDSRSITTSTRGVIANTRNQYPRD